VYAADSVTQKVHTLGIKAAGELVDVQEAVTLPQACDNVEWAAATNSITCGGHHHDDVPKLFGAIGNIEPNTRMNDFRMRSVMMELIPPSMYNKAWTVFPEKVLTKASGPVASGVEYGSRSILGTVVVGGGHIVLCDSEAVAADDKEEL
jgi:hypothetical protein